MKKVIESLFPDYTFVAQLSEHLNHCTYQIQKQNDNEDNGMRILKLFYLENQKQDKLQKTIKMLNKIALSKSPHLLKFYEASFSENMIYMGLILEQADTSLNPQLTEPEIWNVIYKITQAISTIHKLGYVHANIKVFVKNYTIFEKINNVFVHEKLIKLGEPSILFYLKDNEQSSSEFTRSKIYTQKSDLQQLGYLIYQLVFQIRPLEMSKKAFKVYKFNPQYSKNLNNLLQVLMCSEPEIWPEADCIVNYCEQAMLSNEELDLSLLVQKTRLAALVSRSSDNELKKQMSRLLSEKSDKDMKQTKNQPIDNTIYFNNALEDPFSYKQYFKPAKIKKYQSHGIPFQRKTIVSSTLKIKSQELNCEEKDLYQHIPKLPKILKEKYLKSNNLKKIKICRQDFAQIQ